MTGHPDHQTISGWTTWAREAAAQSRLLWATKTPDWIDGFADVNNEVFPPDLPPRTPASSAWTVVLNDEKLEQRVRALEAHTSQTTGLIQAAGRRRYAEWVRQESFREADTRA